MTVREWVWPPGVRFHTRRDETLTELVARRWAHLPEGLRERVLAESVQVKGPEVAA